jgi:hypothetical protein
MENRLIIKYIYKYIYKYTYKADQYNNLIVIIGLIITIKLFLIFFTTANINILLNIMPLIHMKQNGILNQKKYIRKKLNFLLLINGISTKR